MNLVQKIKAPTPPKDKRRGQILTVLSGTAIGIAQSGLVDNRPMIKEGYTDGALENINGHDPYAKLRGEKYSLNEAGTRVPFIFSWPSKISHPFQQNQPFIYLDMLSTFADLINYPLGESDRNDSKSGAALFLTPDAPTYREYFMTQNNGGQIAIQ